MDERDMDEHGAWYKCFKRRKKKKCIIERLLDSNNHLTTTLEEQTKTLTFLTNASVEHVTLVADGKRQLTQTLEEKCSLEVSYRSLKEAYGRTKTKLQCTQNDLRAVSYQRRDLRLEVDKLRKEKSTLAEKYRELDDENTKQKKSLDCLATANKDLKKERRCLQNDLDSSNVQIDHLKAACSDLEKDSVSKTDDLQQANLQKEGVENDNKSLQQLLYKANIDRHKLVHELEATNECLKFEVVMLADALRKKREKIAKLYQEKMLILSYYQERLAACPTSEDNCSALTQFAFQQLATGQSATQDQTATSHASYLQNKILYLESRVYRQSQLIDELTDVIKDYNPDFTIESNPELLMYVDTPLQHCVISDFDGDLDTPGAETTSNDGALVGTAMIDSAYQSATTTEESNFHVKTSLSDWSVISQTSSSSQSTRPADDKPSDVTIATSRDVHEDQTESLDNIGFKLDAAIETFLDSLTVNE